MDTLHNIMNAFRFLNCSGLFGELNLSESKKTIACFFVLFLLFFLIPVYSAAFCKGTCVFTKCSDWVMLKPAVQCSKWDWVLVVVGNVGTWNACGMAIWCCLTLKQHQKRVWYSVHLTDQESTDVSQRYFFLVFLVFVCDSDYYQERRWLLHL